MTAWNDVKRRILASIAVEDPCRAGHCLCIEDGIPSRRKGLILVALRCCRCRKAA